MSFSFTSPEIRNQRVPCKRTFINALNLSGSVSLNLSSLLSNIEHKLVNSSNFTSAEVMLLDRASTKRGAIKCRLRPTAGPNYIHIKKNNY